MSENNQEPDGAEAIGLIGIGLVGSVLAEHLLARGFGVVGYDIDAGRRRVLEDSGGTAVSGSAEVGRRCRRVFMSLMTTDIVVREVEERGGLLEAKPPPRIILDTTTGDPDGAEALAGRLAKRGVAYLDATISGARRQIQSREAVFMIGGERGAYEASRDLLDAITEKAVHVGPAGSGAKAKLASNLILGLNRLTLAEGLVFAERLGLDLAAFLEIVRISPAYSVAVDVKGKRLLEGDFTSPDSRVAQHHKDLSIMLAYADRVGQELPLARVHCDVLERMIEAGEGDLDTAAVIKEIRRLGQTER